MIFPQFTRFFSASLLGTTTKMFLLGSMGALFSINILLWTKETRNPYLLATLKAPWSPTTHEQLAQQYRQEGRTQQAVGELKLARVLGASTNTDEIFQWESERAQIESALAYWQTIAERHPDYRDAFLVLASLSYELGQFDRARAYLSRAEALDPYSEALKRFLLL